MAKRHVNRDGQPFFRKGKDKPLNGTRHPQPHRGPSKQPKVERLVACCLVRGKQMVSRALKSHADIRRFMGDPDPYTEKPGDVPGYFTSSGRFVTREEALPVAIGAGQVPEGFNRTLLSSDIDWEAGL